MSFDRFLDELIPTTIRILVILFIMRTLFNIFWPMISG